MTRRDGGELADGRITCLVALSSIFTGWANLLRRAPTALVIHYTSRDHPNAHELSTHIRHPSPEPGLRRPAVSGLPGREVAHAVLDCSGVTKRDRDTASFPRIL